MPTILHIVTGILGSGKTSVCKHLLTGPSAEGYQAVVVGEFAEEGFDASMLRTTGAKVLQVTATGMGGDAKSYLGPVKQLIEDGRYARIFLETSGVTEIEKVSGDLLGDPDVGSHIKFGPTVTVLDAGSFTNHSKHFAPQLWGQVEVADIVIVNKTDKANEESLDDIRERILEHNPECRVLFAYMGQVQRSQVIGEQAEEFVPRLERGFERTSAPADFEAFVYRTGRVCYDRMHLGHKLLNLPGKIARFKGVLKVWDRPYCVNGMPGQLDWDNTPVEGDTVLAFIGLGLEEHREKIHEIINTELTRQIEEMREER